MSAGERVRAMPADHAATPASRKGAEGPRSMMPTSKRNRIVVKPKDAAIVTATIAASEG